MSFTHNCDHKGCYIKTQTPDWGFLDSSFSGKIRVTDIDGAVEANGCLLIMEWKGEGAPVKDGQRIMFEKITAKNSIVVFIVFGDSAESIVKHIKIYSEGRLTLDKECNNEQLRQFCKQWETKARAEVKAA